MLETILSLVTNLPVLITVIGAAMVAYYYTLGSRHSADFPPMPRRPLPILGHAAFLRPSPPEALLAWKKQLGNVFSFYLGSDLHVALSSYDVLKEALVKKADCFSERPTSFTRRVLNEGKLSGIAGSDWKEHRAVSMSILRSFGMGKNWLGVKINEEVECYLQVLSLMKGEANEVKVTTNSAVSNVICAILFGNRFDYDDQNFLRLLQLVSEPMRLLQTASIIGVFPWLRYLPGDIFGAKRMKELSKEFNRDVGLHYIEKCKSDDIHDLSKDNFIKAYLRESEKRQESEQETSLDDDSISRMIDTFFFTGTETTSTTILWSMVYSMNYPHIQSKVFEEIKDVVGLERSPDLQDKLQLNYVNAFIAEIERIGSIAPLAIPHICSETTVVGGFTIPKDAVIFPHLDAVFKDEKIWGDPMTFRPDRFIGKDGRFFVPEEFVPFSLGRRMCLGESLARMELFLFISAIFQRFEVVPEDPNKLPSLEPIIGLGYMPQPFKVRFIKRPQL